MKNLRATIYIFLFVLSKTIYGSTDISLQEEFLKDATGYWQSSCGNGYKQEIEFYKSGHFNFIEHASNGLNCNDADINRVILMNGASVFKVLRKLNQFKKGYSVEFFFNPIKVYDPNPSSDSNVTFYPVYTCKDQSIIKPTQCDCNGTSKVAWVVFKDDAMYMSINAAFHGCSTTGRTPEPKDFELVLPYYKS